MGCLGCSEPMELTKLSRTRLSYSSQVLTLRGKDIPGFPSAKALKGATFPSQKKRGSLVICSRTGVKKVYGPPGAIFDEHGAFYWSVQSHSQLPTLTCFHQRIHRAVREAYGVGWGNLSHAVGIDQGGE